MWNAVRTGDTPAARGIPSHTGSGVLSAALKNNLFPPAAESYPRANPRTDTGKNTLFFLKTSKYTTSIILHYHSIETELSVASHHMPLCMRNWDTLYYIILKINQFFTKMTRSRTAYLWNFQDKDQAGSAESQKLS